MFVMQDIALHLDTFSELNAIDQSRANHLANKINSGVLKNFKETSDFWKNMKILLR